MSHICLCACMCAVISCAFSHNEQRVCVFMHADIGCALSHSDPLVSVRVCWHRLCTFPVSRLCVCVSVQVWTVH